MPLPSIPAPRLPIDLATRRTASEAALRAVVDAPVRHLPAAFLLALQGSWGTPAELGVAVPVQRLAVAR